MGPRGISIGRTTASLRGDPGSEACVDREDRDDDGDDGMSALAAGLLRGVDSEGGAGSRRRASGDGTGAEGL